MVLEHSTPMVRLVPGYRQNLNVRWGMIPGPGRGLRRYFNGI